MHSGGERFVQGVPAIAGLAIEIRASIPDGMIQIEHVCWSDESDGVIVAVRWVLVGSNGRGGILGRQIPVGQPVYMMGSSHFRLAGPRIIEEWSVFEQIAVLALAYRS